MTESDLTTYEWVRVDGFPIRIMKSGNWAPYREEKALFVIIPGNPGSIGCYQTFAEALFSESGIPVWGISHTGHASIPENLSSLGEEHPKVEDCGVLPQIHHKISFLEQEVLPKVDKVHLVGHSLGCYIILHILDRLNHPKLHKGIMLFPAIERIAASPRGKWLIPLLVHWPWRQPFSCLVWVLKWLPGSVKTALVDCLFKHTNEPARLSVLNDILCPEVAHCYSFLGMQSCLLAADKRDDHIIEEQAGKLHFYYGRNDDWCPELYYEDMKKDYGDMDVRLCQNNFSHAFVLKEAEEVATMVAEWAKDF